MSDSGPASASHPGPFTQSIERLRREFDRWVETALHSGERALEAVRARGGERQWVPSIDVVETPTDVRVDVDLPGVDSTTVEVSLAGNMLTISGPRKTCPTIEGSTPHLGERMHGAFHRSIPLPCPVNHDNIQADMKNGVLKVRLIKTPAAQGMKISIRTESSGLSSSS